MDIKAMILEKVHELARTHKSWTDFKSAIDKEFNGTPTTVVDNSTYLLIQTNNHEQRRT